MKCPKCGYLGFETTDRCRNCGYDFSLTSPGASPELPLRATGGPDGPLGELTLQTEPAPVVEDGQALEPAGQEALAEAPASEVNLDTPSQHRIRDQRDVSPIVSPPPAGSPLAVRRASGDVPRVRRSTTRPSRPDTPALPLALEPVPSATGDAGDEVGRDPAPVPAALPARLTAAIIDLAILDGIGAAVIWLTLRIAGLDFSFESLELIRPIPMAAFLLLLAFLYVVGFTLGGGQTIGKMVCGVRVIGDDGRRIDAAGAVVRGAGWLVTAGTLGVLFLPALFRPDRRAPHDRLAGTRVVRA
jgi:uncharacterized RDD family membrane protein YckC